jgi:hypothetical protein
LIEMLYQGSVSNYSIQIHSSTWTGPFGYTRIVVLAPIALSGGGSGLAFLDFVPAGRPVPDRSKRGGTTDPIVWDLFLPMDDYAAIVDLVRNEKPINFYFDDATPDGWAVTTGSELVGQDQGK